MSLPHTPAAGLAGCPHDNMDYSRHRPSSHFIAPHSWANDPCGAVFVPESQEYIVCYQWNPGSTEGGNCAWGMARSKDLVVWEDCPPAIWNGTTYDRLGVFSGCIVSRLVDGQRVLYLFYTSVSTLPIHWSKPYLKGCETQSVAISTDLGKTWVKDDASNPLITRPPKGSATTGWRDPFVTKSMSLSTLLGVAHDTDFMMLASGERGCGPQLQLYKSKDLKTNKWEYVSTVLDVKMREPVAEGSNVKWGVNFECASFFTMNDNEYIIVGVEETEESSKHNGHYLLWLLGSFIKDDHGQPTFDIKAHGVLDHGVLYAAHIFRDEHERLIQLGWADETAKKEVVQKQGWAGCLGHPRELFAVCRPTDEVLKNLHEWHVNEAEGFMTTLGVRPAKQVDSLRPERPSVDDIKAIQSRNYEITATFSDVKGDEKFTFNVLESPNREESTSIIFDLEKKQLIVDRSRSSAAYLGTSTPDIGSLSLAPDEDLSIRIFVDTSIIEIFVNDRVALTSRVYPSLETSTGVSYNFGCFESRGITIQSWVGLTSAWPLRETGGGILPELFPVWEAKTELKASLVSTTVIPVAVGAGP